MENHARAASLPFTESASRRTLLHLNGGRSKGWDWLEVAPTDRSGSKESQ